MNLEQLAKEHDFKEGHEYLNYIVESWYNGQMKQFFKLFKALKESDRSTFFQYMEDTCISTDEQIKITNYIAENL